MALSNSSNNSNMNENNLYWGKQFHKAQCFMLFGLISILLFLSSFCCSFSSSYFALRNLDTKASIHQEFHSKISRISKYTNVHYGYAYEHFHSLFYHGINRKRHSLKARAVTSLSFTLSSIASQRGGKRKRMRPFYVSIHKINSKLRVTNNDCIEEYIEGDDYNGKDYFPSNASSQKSIPVPLPPKLHRDNERYVWAGNATSQKLFSNEKNTSQKYHRQLQSQDSPYNLLNPPIPIPDPYGWMRDYGDDSNNQQNDDKQGNFNSNNRKKQKLYSLLQEEQKYLKDVNAYFYGGESKFIHYQNKLYHEMKSHVQETDFTAPILSQNYYHQQKNYSYDHKDSNHYNQSWVYYTRHFQNQSHPIYCRAPAPSTILTYYNNYHHHTQSDTGVNYSVFDYHHYDEKSLEHEKYPLFPNEVQYLNVNELKSSFNSSYLAVGLVQPSPSHEFLAYSLDSTGNETCQLYIMDMATLDIVQKFEYEYEYAFHNNNNADIAMTNVTSITNITFSKDFQPNSQTEQKQIQYLRKPFEIDGLIVWGNDDSSLYYIKVNEVHRPYRVYRRTLDLNRSNTNMNMTQKEIEEELIYEETDPRYNIHIYKSQDGKYLFIDSASEEASEVMFVDLNDPYGEYVSHRIKNATNNDDCTYRKSTAETHSTNSRLSTCKTRKIQVQTIAKRRSKVLYDVEHFRNSWLITTNWNPNITQTEKYTNHTKFDCERNEKKKVANSTVSSLSSWNASAISDKESKSMKENSMPNMRLMISPDTPDCAHEWEDLVLVESPNCNNCNTSDCNYSRTYYIPNNEGRKTAKTSQIPESSSVLFDGKRGAKALNKVTPFENHIVCEGRQGGIPRIWIIGFDNLSGTNRKGDDDGINEKVEKMKQKKFLRNLPVANRLHQLTFPEPTYNALLNRGTNNIYYTNVVNVMYTSLVTPLETIAINMDSPEMIRMTLWRKRVPNYDKNLYESYRTFIPSRDGATQIPVSMVYRPDSIGFSMYNKSKFHNRDQANILSNENRKNKSEKKKYSMKRNLGTTKKDAFVHLVGYGSYGSTLEANFDAIRLPLLDRGFVYVLAHVRGGGEMGREWYEEPNGGKLLCKKNTFNDFVDVARWLVGKNRDEKSNSDVWITKPEKMSCEGR